MYGLRTSSVLAISTTRRICSPNKMLRCDRSLDTLERCTYVDRPEAGTMPGGHVLVEGLDGIGTAELTELLVHVVRAGTRVVTDPDTEVLHLERLLLRDL